MRKSLLNISNLPKLPPLTDIEKQLLEEKVDIDSKYKLPKEIKLCDKCVITNQRPRITINEDGICNPCKYWARKHSSFDWNSLADEFRELCDKYRSSDGSYDVLVPSSGGKDSSYVAYRLRDEYDMHPLTVTWSPSLYTEIGFENFQNHIHHGLDNVLVTANGLVHRRLCRSSTIIMGDPFQPFVYGQCNVPLRIAKAYDIPLIVDGENGEVEYGGDDNTEQLTGFQNDESVEFWQSGMAVEEWQKYGYSDSELFIYQPPKQQINVRRVFFSYYHNWMPHDHYYYASQNAGFVSNPDRSECTFSRYASLDDSIDPFHYYFALLKFGIGRATSDAAHELREGVLERDEAIQLVNKFDCQAPSKETTEIFLKYCSIDKGALQKIVDRWTNSRIWSARNDLPSLQF